MFSKEPYFIQCELMRLPRGQIVNAWAKRPPPKKLHDSRGWIWLLGTVSKAFGEFPAVRAAGR